MNDSCPTFDQLRHVLDDTLTALERQAIEPHLESCQACRDVLDTLTEQTGLPAFGAALLAGLDTGRLASVDARPRYQFVRHHEGGGSADVFEFWDEQLQRPVALKLLRDPHRADPDRRRRFLAEAQVTARLAHPGIAPVYALAQTSDGQTGCVMALVRGNTLAEAIEQLHGRGGFPSRADDARRLLRPLLGRFIALCSTVAYAHDQKVLHCDIKPGNVILGIFGETVLVDWGLSRCLDEIEARQTAVGQTPADTAGLGVLVSNAGGTFGFTSPEQTRTGHRIGPASDIFSLGATLYCLLTGRAPFRNPTAPEEGKSIVQQVRNGEFPPPRMVNPNVHPNLEAICRKAMALQPANRYAAASDLASDVDRWLAGEPISARREPWIQHCWRLAKRYRGASASVAATFLVVLISLAVATPFLRAAYTREKEQRTEAEAQRARANNNLKTALFVMDYSLTRARKDRTPAPSSVVELRDFYLPKLMHFYEQLLAHQDDQGHEARQLVGRAYHGLGVCYTLNGDTRQGEANYLSAQAIQRQLTEEIADPQQLVPHAADLAVTRIDLARLYGACGRVKEEAAVQQQIAAAYEAFADRKHAYLFALGVAQRFEDLGQSAESMSWLGKVIDALEDLLRQRPDQPDVRAALAQFSGGRALNWFREQRYDLALKDWARRSELTADPLPTNVRIFRAGSLAKQGAHVEAAAEAEALAGASNLGPDDMYNLACTLALAAAAAHRDQNLPPTQRDVRAERYAKSAVTWLRKSHSTGFFRIPGAIEQFKKDADFEPLRSRDDFKRFLGEVEKKN
jgi:serine/threonine protein kinase